MLIAPAELDSDILFDTMHLDPTETRTVRATAEQPASFHDAAAGRSSGAAPREAGAAAAAAKGGVGLSLRGLSKAYAARQVLADIDLELTAGEFVAVVGRSGCGKSTLLRTIAQLEQTSAGRIVYGDGKASPDMRIMFQEARLLPWKSVLENVALGLPKASAAAADALATVGLAERGGDWPAALSGGQRQRVALARALVHQPQLLLLDEPLGALDALTRIEMQQLIESLWLARGFTAVLVTHDVQEAVALADRVILIEEGRISVDARIDLPRPRARGSAAFAALEQRILAHVLKTPVLEDAAAPLPPLSRLKWAI